MLESKMTSASSPLLHHVLLPTSSPREVGSPGKELVLREKGWFSGNRRVGSPGLSAFAFTSLVSGVGRSLVAAWFGRWVGGRFFPENQLFWDLMSCLAAPDCSGLLLPTAGRSWSPLTAHVCIVLLLTAPGCSWLLLGGPGCSWLLLATRGCSWLLLAAPGHVGHAGHGCHLACGSVMPVTFRCRLAHFAPI